MNTALFTRSNKRGEIRECSRQQAGFAAFIPPATHCCPQHSSSLCEPSDARCQMQPWRHAFAFRREQRGRTRDPVSRCFFERSMCTRGRRRPARSAVGSSFLQFSRCHVSVVARASLRAGHGASASGSERRIDESIYFFSSCILNFHINIQFIACTVTHSTHAQRVVAAQLPSQPNPPTCCSSEPASDASSGCRAFPPSARHADTLTAIHHQG